ncbi:MAG: Transcriptional regulator, MarR family [Herbinix sp.]|jgi:DNA-binding MarR family transcriptional regulator|nr:Transcriptional regulator, MarR family [Herbinix sp.]
MNLPPDRDNKYVIFALIFMLSNQLQTIGDSFFAEISTKQWFVLVILGIMDGYSPTLNELSSAVGSSHQNVKQLVLKLEQKGYVELSKDAEDGRRLRITPTRKSEEFSKAYDKKSSAFMSKLFDHFEETDLAATKKVMLSMRDRLEGMEKDYVGE